MGEVNSNNVTTGATFIIGFTDNVIVAKKEMEDKGFSEEEIRLSELVATNELLSMTLCRRIDITGKTTFPSMIGIA